MLPAPQGRSPVSPLIWTLRQAKRLVITVLGVSLLVIGTAMIVLPGPAIIVIPAGLAVLATEFLWARNLLHKVRDRFPRRKKAV